MEENPPPHFRGGGHLWVSVHRWVVLRQAAGTEEEKVLLAFFFFLLVY